MGRAPENLCQRARHVTQAGGGSQVNGCLCRPLRGHARSHRDRTGFENRAVPVGAGVPAKRPVQATHCSQAEKRARRPFFIQPPK
ncbi:hypothetical protein DZC31_21705 [Stenotrophomonas rhizophila]|nr:hypothetical protein DZC31_21705 [Stenotrophomonas rhizophila]